MDRVPVIAVVGGNRAPTAALAQAERLGAAIVERGWRLATGGRGGVMAAASRGARGATAWVEGRVVAVLPGVSHDDANPWADVVVPTGLGLARNVVLVSMADAVVAVGGGSGTLSEVALAWQLDKPVVALDVGAGWSARLAGERLDDRRADQIWRAADAAHAVELVAQLLGAPR